MSMVPEVELSANEIYEFIKSGNGVGSMGDARGGIDQLRANLLERKDLLASLKNEISEMWEGDASEAALGGLTQAVDTLIADVDSAVLSNAYMGAQAEAFVQILHTVVPASAEPPLLTEEDIQRSENGEIGAYQQKLKEWENQCQINVDAFNEYHSASTHNGQLMPSMHAILHDESPPEQKQITPGGVRGDSGGLASAGSPSISATTPQKFSPNMENVASHHNSAAPQTQYQPTWHQPTTPHSPNFVSQPSATTHTASSPGSAGNVYGNPSPIGSPYGGQGYAGGNFGRLGSGSVSGTPGYYGHIPGAGTEAPKNGRVAGSVPTLPPGENTAANARNAPTNHRPAHSTMPFGGAPGGVRNDEQLEHRRPSFLIEPDPDEIFGCNVTTVPPVIGYVPKPAEK